MKRVSGEFLSRLLWAVQQCNVAERTPEEIKSLLLAALDVRDLYVDMPSAEAATPASQAPAPRRVSFDDGNLQRLNAMLPWSSFSTMGQGALLGAPWSSAKRSKVSAFPDSVVEKLNATLPLAGLSVLELGCFEGMHSLSLAQHAREVWGIDGRIENVIKSLVRVWVAGMEQKIVLHLLDLERGTLKDQLAALGRTEPFDVMHHRGVLYHLSDPIGNLEQCAAVTRQHLYLHTQIASEAQADVRLQHVTGDYPAYRYREPNPEFAPFAGITAHAHWMTRASLERLLKAIGFPKINVLAEVEERNGLRLELIASR
jgi:2-polyprenyl-3-methyl-5-hydroxy-6-metoxy-1,4-benzoquinol methylase